MADSRPTSGTFNYHEHYASFYTYTNIDYPTGLHNHGGGVWYVQRSDVGGTWFTSTGNPSTAGYEAQVGTETHEPTASGDIHDCGYVNQLEYQVSGSTTTYSGWAGAAVIANNPPSTFTWTSTGHNANVNVTNSC